MSRITFLLPLLLLLLTACDTKVGEATGEATNAVADMAEKTMEETDKAMDTAKEAMTEAAGGMVKVIDATIKSPRKELSGSVAGVPVTINYGSPAVNDRVIYGDLVPYNKVWRTGANEATRITFSEDVIVGADAKKLKAGTYALFTLPSSKEDWTIIFNSEAEQWGAYDYDDSKDAVRAAASALPAAEKAERMDFMLTDESIQLVWDDLVVAFPVASSAK